MYHHNLWRAQKFFLEGGAVFQKFLNLIFRALQIYYRDPILSKFFCAADRCLKNQAKKGISRNFWKILTKNNCVFSARAPPKN